MCGCVGVWVIYTHKHTHHTHTHMHTHTDHAGLLTVNTQNPPTDPKQLAVPLGRRGINVGPMP